MGALVPLAVTAGSALVSHYANKGNKSPLAANQAGSVTDAMGAARTAGAQGASLFGTGAPLLTQAASYYQRLLSGDQATVQSAVAPQRAAINESARGAATGIERGPLRGGARDVARAELDRSRMGAIGMLVPNAINQAAPQAASLGLGAATAGQAGAGQAGSIYTALTGQGEGARQFDTEQSYKLGGNIGGFLTNLLSTYYQGKGGGKKAPSGAPPSVAYAGGGHDEVG